MMCGIVALKGTLADKVVHRMMERMKHRGPDGEGTCRIGDTTLGHVRLAILDLEDGQQPMFNELGDLAVAFNGEIYNHLTLRQSLESHHHFRTRSDTEVLLHLYEDESTDMLARLDGMFAFAMAGPEGLLLARDPIGIKPLYYGRIENHVLAASELKAFPPMDELYVLPASHALIVGDRPWPYVRLRSPFSPLTRPSLPDILADIRRLLEQAVLKRLMSDVPVGVFLSGGLDSSLVAALMRPRVAELHSFAAGMAGAPDLEAARQVAEALGTTHHEVVYTAEDIRKALPEVIYHLESFDAPLVRSAVPTYFVSRLAARHVKVVLTGEGADELFAGYSYLARLGGGKSLKRELGQITQRLQDTNLQRTDRMTMAHGLEGRVPFLDLDLVRYVVRLPVELIEPRPDRLEKWLLREACQALLPPSILKRRKLKFSKGAGSAEVMAEWVCTQITETEFSREQEVAPGVVLRSPEELLYYRIWRAVMPSHIHPALVGRTRDRSAGCRLRLSQSN